MKKIHSILIISAICHLAYGQQIAEIIEYTPAPGQFINTASGVPDAAETLTQEGGGLVSLGGFGGYIIVSRVQRNKSGVATISLVCYDKCIHS